MEPKTNETTDLKRKPFTAGVVALAVISLLAGASVSATLEEFAAPVYAEGDSYAGAVDDATGEAAWDEIKTDDKGAKKQAKDWIHKRMKNRMDDRLEDRVTHLEQRIEADNTLIAAFQHCIDSEDCTADTVILTVMLAELTERTHGIQAKLDGTDAKSDSDGVWGEKDWVERKDWPDEDKRDFAEDKMEQIEAARIAIGFCMESEDCEADAGTLRIIVTHMADRANHHRECTDDRRCDRDHDDRRGLAERMRRAFCERTDRCDRDDTDRDWSENDRYEITQEDCETRGGTWTEAPDRGEDYYYCDWGESNRGESDEEPGQ
jgi:hypothetical protein